MNIGDLMLRILADDKGFEADLVKKTGKAGDKAGATLGARMGSAIKKSGIGIADGLKIGAGINAFGAIDSAISSTIGFLGDAVAAAREDQESISRLGAALKANIPAWDGNTKAIEATILARQQLGFTDDEQRKSLALLVAATHDVNKALDINATAMDLARLKGISLEEASSALVKVEGGQYRALKALGIVLPKNATATEALAAVQKVAAGQADAYAKTNEGRLLISQIKVSEAMEKLGYIIMPAVADVMAQLADAAGPVVDGIVGIVKAAQDGVDWLNQLAGAGSHTADDVDMLGSKSTALGKALHWLADQPGHVVDMINGTSDATRDAATQYERTGMRASELADDLAGLAKKGGRSFSSLGDSVQDLRNRIARNADAIKTRIHNLTASLVAEAQALIDGYYDPIIAQDELRVAKDQVAADTVARNATKAGTAERREADLTLANSQKNLDQTRLNLLAAGTLTKKDQEAWLTDLRKKYQSATGAAKTALGSLIDTILRLQNVSAPTISIRVGRSGSSSIARAAGGPITAGRTYLVNENTPNSELWTPNVSGRILGPGAVPAAAGSGGGVVNNWIMADMVQGTIPYRDPLTISRSLQRLGRTGSLTPEAQ